MAATEDRDADLRGRVAMLNQLLLCVILVVIVLAVAITDRAADHSLLLVATVIVLAGGAATLVVPWARIARAWVYVIPLADIVAIGLARSEQHLLGIELLWAFPVMWMATLGLTAFLTAAALVLVEFGAIIALAGASGSAVSYLLPAAVIVAIGVTSYVSSRRYRAQRVLLDKQTALLSGALSRAQGHEELMTDVLDAVDFGVIRITADGEVSVFNEALGRIQRSIPGFGRLDRPIGDAYAADGVTLIEEPDRPLRRALRGELFENEVIWFGPPDQPRTALSMTARQLRSGDGAPAGCVIVARDVTAELTALRARDRLVSSISHELRTPLTSVLGYIDLAIDHLDRPDDAARDLDVAAKNGERLLEIIADILAASSTSRGSIDLTISPKQIDVAELVQQAAEAWRARAAYTSISIDATDVLPASAWADAARIRQVVDNLVSNAVKYNVDGGSIAVRTSSDGTSTFIDVQDTGVGISAEDQRRLFEQYFRARRDVEGSGLGLSISRDIVRAHGGDITVRSAPGTGSTFTVRLPAQPRGQGDRELHA
ncbi:MAG: hypothetical protein ABT08_02845 [Microbacterium sp. SCN 71-21]|uniref:sensor histidine kinase n=1 Tax=Microbacterium sp. SCN 71-21 TaxID=1660116 RepID=UPI00086A47CF|nr:PAS domain-containing sensor histidine kinase [Microbacterium sp. SCN 71-21]ODU78888.1 MAG: hypothetical protein ABT08_02845 [Microbacterium sp. SCN 71-21]